MKLKKNCKINNIIIILLLIIFPCRLYGNSWWNVYFTNPGGEKVNIINDQNPENGLLKLIKNSKKSFYGAFYEISSKPIIRELINSKNRGNDIRLALEKDNISKEETRELINAGISIVTDDRKPLMHNKFAIIDGEILWTGSFNLTYNDAYKNNNNAIAIWSKDLANIYLYEFNEMFNDHVFGNKKEYRIFNEFRKKNFCRIGTTDINVFFSPEDDIEKQILIKLKTAKESVSFMAFSFTNNKIGDELVILHKKGIKVLGIIEKIGANSRDSEYIKLKLEGIPVELDKNKYRMHHKVIVIDKECLITGSFNFSKGANERNDENIVIIYNKEIADLYIKELYRLLNIK